MKNIQKKAFTLVEMMIVVAIIAVLAVPQYNKYVKKSEATEAIRFMKQIVDAQGIYFSTHGKYVDNLPANNDGLKILGTEINDDGKFKNYKVKACDTTDKNDGVVIQAYTDDGSGTENSVYMYYPTSYTPANHSADKYDNTVYMYSYINGEISDGGIPDCI
jgi:prepilin-type N-terminal cleavage/methylation domain-containing protein